MRNPELRGGGFRTVVLKMLACVHGPKSVAAGVRSQHRRRISEHVRGSTEMVFSAGEQYCMRPQEALARRCCALPRVRL